MLYGGNFSKGLRVRRPLILRLQQRYGKGSAGKCKGKDIYIADRKGRGQQTAMSFVNRGHGKGKGTELRSRNRMRRRQRTQLGDESQESLAAKQGG